MKKIELPYDRENIKEITITILGNANSGKSSLVGILTNCKLYNIDSLYENNEMKYLNYENNEMKYLNYENNNDDFIYKEILDDGNGKSRYNILQFDHEKKSGRTSSITYSYMVLNKGYKIINFVDLAGHESYLRTTIKGITSSYPDYALICIEKSITKITKEHIQLVFTLSIPLGFIFSKIDIIPDNKQKKNIEKIFKIIKQLNKKHFIIKSYKDLDVIKANMENIVPIFFISNKTGHGINKLIKFINTIEKKTYNNIPKGFVIDNIYNVFGFGTVVSGINGINIKKNDELYLGPINNTEFKKIKIRTIHDDYRNFVDELLPNKRGCLCIKLDNEQKKYLKSGLIITKSIKDTKFTKKFIAKIHIFRGTFSTIKEGYCSYLNTGLIRSTVKIIRFIEKNIQNSLMRAGNTALVELEFLNRSFCISIGDIFIIREGSSIGFGKITEI